MSDVEPYTDPPSPVDAPTTDLPSARWRFETPDFTTVERWLRSQADLSSGGEGAEFAVTEGAPHKIHDRFLDAPDLAVLRAGYALRVRRGAHGTVAALLPPASRTGGAKALPPAGTAPPAAGPRTFLQELDSGQQTALLGGNGPVSERLHTLGVATKLQTLVEIRTQRRVVQLRRRPSSGESGSDQPGSEDSVPVEIVLDASFVTDPLGRTHRLSRVDVITPAASAPASRGLIEVLRRECDLSEATRSRFDWAMEVCGVQADRTMSFGRASVDPLMSVGQVADAVMRKQCASFLWNEPGTRLGEDPEHLHDMRVASRRMRAALRLFRSALAPGEADSLRLQLREVARTLGAVRDLDVFIEQLGELSHHLVGANAEACEPLFRHLSLSRERARQQLMNLLDDLSFVSLKRALVSRMHAGEVQETPESGVSILTAAPGLIRRCRRRVLQSGHDLRPDTPPAVYHELRIHGKRLRYALEFLEGVYGPLVRNLIDILVEMQDQLGLLQDARVSVQTLRAITEERPAGFTGNTWVALGELIQLYEGRSSNLRHGIPRLLRRLEGKRWRALRRAMKKLAAAEEISHPREGADRDEKGSTSANGGLGAAPQSAGTDDPPIDTDRPEKTNPSTT